MSKGLLFEEGLFVLLVAEVLLHGGLFHALGLLDALFTGLKDAVNLGAQSDILLKKIFKLREYRFLNYSIIKNRRLIGS